MNFEEASAIGKRRAFDAALRLSVHVKERAMEVCAVKPAKGSGIDTRDWEPVGEELLKEMSIVTGPMGDQQAYLLIVDADGKAKACTARAYPLRIAQQMALAMPLGVYTGRDGVLIEYIQDEALRKAQGLAQLPDV